MICLFPCEGNWRYIRARFWLTLNYRESITELFEGLILHSMYFCIKDVYRELPTVKLPCNLFITGRNEVVAKVMFLQVSVIHSVHRGGGGGLPQCMLGYHPLGPGRPPLDQADPLGQADTPQTRQTPPSPGPGRNPPRPGRHPPGPGRPPSPGSRLQHMVYERPVRSTLPLGNTVNSRR